MKKEIGIWQFLGMLLLFESLFFNLMNHVLKLDLDVLTILIAYLGGLAVSK